MEDIDEVGGHVIDAAFRIDLIVDDRLLVEVKSVERLIYLRLKKQPVGLLINFGGATLKEGLRRIVNDYKPFASSRESII